MKLAHLSVETTYICPNAIYLVRMKSAEVALHHFQDMHVIEQSSMATACLG